jgi:hypothetical protein
MSPAGALVLGAAVLVALGASPLAWGIFAVAAVFELVAKPFAKALMIASQQVEQSPDE